MGYDTLFGQRRLPIMATTDNIAAGNFRDKTPYTDTLTGFQSELSYQNGFPYAIVVIFRSSIAVKIPPLTDTTRREKGFVIHQRLRFPRSVNFDVHRVLDEVDSKSPIELQVIQKAYNDSKGGQVARGHECVLTYGLTRSKFEKAGGSVYLEELDIVICRDTDEAQTVHPASVEGHAMALREEQRHMGFVFNVRIHDTSQQYGDRFINLAGMVYRVLATADKTVPDGVYIQAPSPSDQFVTEQRHYTFEKADQELPLFRTANDALILGDVAEARKRENEEFQFGLKRQYQETEMKHKQELLDLDKQLAALKQEKAELEMEHVRETYKLKEENLEIERILRGVEAEAAREKQARDKELLGLKDTYERRSMARKDWSEFAKWLPTIVAALAIVYVNYTKTTSKEE